MWTPVLRSPLGCLATVLLTLAGLALLAVPYVLLALAAAGICVAVLRRTVRTVRALRDRTRRGAAGRSGSEESGHVSASGERLRPTRRTTRTVPRWAVLGAAGGLLLLPPASQPLRAVAGHLINAGLCGDPYVLAEVTSPDGRHVARAVVWGCGGAAGSVHREVTVRHRRDVFALYAGRIAEFRRASGEVRLVWETPDTLAVEYEGELLGAPPAKWRELQIVYRRLG